MNDAEILIEAMGRYIGVVVPERDLILAGVARPAAKAKTGRVSKWELRAARLGYRLSARQRERVQGAA